MSGRRLQKALRTLPGDVVSGRRLQKALRTLPVVCRLCRCHIQLWLRSTRIVPHECQLRSNRQARLMAGCLPTASSHHGVGSTPLCSSPRCAGKLLLLVAARPWWALWARSLVATRPRWALWALLYCWHFDASPCFDGVSRIHPGSICLCRVTANCVGHHATRPPHRPRWASVAQRHCS